MTTDNETSEDHFDPQEELIKRWTTGDDVLSPPDDETVDDEDHEDDAEDDILSDAEDDGDVDNETETDEVEDDEPEEKPKRKAASDDDVVSLTVNGEEIEVSVKDLKRLHGQERAIQHRSKDLAIAEKTLADQSQATRLAAETLYGRAAEKAKQWEGFDWVGMLKDPNIDQTTYNELRSLAEKDYADLNFYRDGLESEMQRYQDRQVQADKTRIQTTIAELSNADTGIEGFNEALFQEIGTYALSMGVPQDRMSDLLHTPLMKIIHDGLRYRKTLAATKATTPVKKAPTKIVKSTSNSESSRKAISGNSGKEAKSRLAATGSRDDALKALMSGWQDD